MASVAGVQSRLIPGSGEESGPGGRVGRGGAGARRAPRVSVRWGRAPSQGKRSREGWRGEKSGVWLSYSYSKRKKEVPRLITLSGVLTGESNC